MRSTSSFRQRAAALAVMVRANPARAGLAALGAVLCGVALAQASGCGGPAERRPRVGVAMVERRTVATQAEYKGTVAAVASVDVRARVRSLLVHAPFHEGQLVYRGQLVLMLQRNQYAAALQAAQGRLLAAQANRERARSRSARAAADAALVVAEAAVETAAIDLGYTKVYAPLTGRIGFLRSSVGNLVGLSPADQVLDSIASVDPAQVRFALDDRTYSALSRQPHGSPIALPNQQLVLIRADKREYVHHGRIYAVNPALDATSRTLTAEARFPNPGGALRPGQAVRVRLTLAKTVNALLVPQSAIVSNGGATYAYVVDAKSVAQLRPVSISNRYGHDFAVKGGLAAGDRVIVRGALGVRPGLTVTVGS